MTSGPPYQEIKVNSAGAKEYTWPTTLTELTGKNINSDAVQICLGTTTDPGTWVTPDVVTHPTTSSVTVQLMVGGNGNAGTPYKPPAGYYGLWVNISDNPEFVPRLAALITIS